MAKHAFDVSISREQTIRVIVDDDEVGLGEDLEDVAEEYALEGKGRVVDDNYTVEEISPAAEGLKAA